MQSDKETVESTEEKEMIELKEEATEPSSQNATEPIEEKSEESANEGDGEGSEDEEVGNDDSEKQEESAETLLEKKLEKSEEEAKKLQDRMLRIAADFDNFKKRARRDVKEAKEQSENKLVVEFLPILDNLERAIKHGAESCDDDSEGSLLSGVQMVHKQFIGLFGRYDIEPIESIGQPFDPEFHEALQQMPSKYPKNHVAEEFQKGYRRGDRLVRAAMVVVSTGPVEGEEEDAAAEEDIAVEVEVENNDTQMTSNSDDNKENKAANEEDAAEDNNEKSE